MACPLCNSKRFTETGTGRVVRCSKCEAVYGHCYLGELSLVVNIYRWDEADCGPEAERYFDVETLGSQGLERHHGWFNPKTRRITQAG